MSERGDDKRLRILDAALTEMAEHGFARASTNAVAERAGVAKGLVFHHFGSKEDLFLAVLDDVLARLVPGFEAAVAEAPPDLFARVLAWTDRKLSLLREDPRRLRFFLVAVADAPEEIRDRAAKRAERLVRAMLPRLLEGIDPRRLRPGVAPAEALDAVWTMTAGLERKLLPLLSRGGRASQATVEQAFAASRRMLELLRDGLYARPDDQVASSGAPTSSSPGGSSSGSSS